ncbi:hypothetical protein L484_025602 [Morus notabilis]|uniref:Uncharacterized protein n=1 Tax=Morus notabilis TaxID=981085 RepID=W9RGX3_9ROSA|nr:hypothetical protein L484_025602 [Morus notabilis]
MNLKLRVLVESEVVVAFCCVSVEGAAGGFLPPFWADFFSACGAILVSTIARSYIAFFIGLVQVGARNSGACTFWFGALDVC